MQTTAKKTGVGICSKSKSDSSYATNDLRWNSVCRNDAAADGHYWYAVKTTGVYCRPSCTSRQPLRKNVLFFRTTEEAEIAGFRPCKRCGSCNDEFKEEQRQKIIKACRLLEQADEEISLNQLAQKMAMSKYHFHRLFVNVMGMTPKAYSKELRAGKIRKNLVQGGSVTQALYDSGYSTNRQFYEESTRILGMQPRKYQQGGKGERICFAVGECSLGSVLVASSVKGICALSLGGEPKKLIEELEQRFQHAEIIGGDRHYEHLVARVIGLLEKTGSRWDLPLDIRGTTFQRRVWKALQEIPPGHPITYSELAGKIGIKGASRAVANACAANPLAVAIPCHRVIRLNGSLSGYRWGVQRKKALLERESQLVKS